LLSAVMEPTAFSCAYQVAAAVFSCRRLSRRAPPDVLAGDGVGSAAFLDHLVAVEQETMP